MNKPPATWHDSDSTEFFRRLLAKSGVTAPEYAAISLGTDTKARGMLSIHLTVPVPLGALQEVAVEMASEAGQ